MAYQKKRQPSRFRRSRIWPLAALSCAGILAGCQVPKIFGESPPTLSQAAEVAEKSEDASKKASELLEKAEEYTPDLEAGGPSAPGAAQNAPQAAAKAAPKITGVAACKRIVSLTNSAQLDNFAFNFSSADEKFRESLVLHGQEFAEEGSQCPNLEIPSRSFLLTSRALALSNQEQFLLAGRLLSQAREALGEDPPIEDKLFLQNALIQHSLNLPKDRADKYAIDANKEIEGLWEILDSREIYGAIRPSSASTDDLINFDQEGIRQIIGTALGIYAASVAATNDERHDEARVLISQAIAEIDRVPGIGAGYLPRFLVQKAIIDLQRGDPETARNTAQSAVNELEKAFSNTSLIARAVLVKAYAQSETGDIDGALQSYERAFSIYRENPTTVAYESIWPFFRLGQQIIKTSPQYKAEIEKRMFEAAQIIRSPTVAHAIASSTAAVNASKDSSIVAKLLQELQAAEEAYRLVNIQDVLSQGNLNRSIRGRSNAGRRLEQARLRRQKARQALGMDGGKIAPGAENYLSVIGAPASLREIQLTLYPGEALVQVLTGEPRGIVFVVSRTSLEIFFMEAPTGTLELVSGAKFPRKIENYPIALLNGLRRSADVGELYPYRVDIAYQAFMDIFGRARTSLAQYDRLLFAISGPLSGIPMELLVTKDPIKRLDRVFAGDYTGVSWLGDQAQISYIPSPRNILDLRRARVGAEENPIDEMVVFSGYQKVAPTQIEAESQSLLRAHGLSSEGDKSNTDIGCGRIARDIVEALISVDMRGDDAKALGNTLKIKNTIISGLAFTQANLRAQAQTIERADILHFSTHGLLWDSPDCFVEPALTINVDNRFAGGTLSNDRLLTASEIQSFKTNAQLVVLSACDTAGGDGLGGESLSGLARAFFLGGARAVIATHWQVEKQATDILMKRMYQFLSYNTVDFRTALTQSQATFRSSAEYSHPYYWAAFILIGDGTDITL